MVSQVRQSQSSCGALHTLSSGTAIDSAAASTPYGSSVIWRGEEREQQQEYAPPRLFLFLFVIAPVPHRRVRRLLFVALSCSLPSLFYRQRSHSLICFLLFLRRQTTLLSLDLPPLLQPITFNPRLVRYLIHSNCRLSHTVYTKHKE